MKAFKYAKNFQTDGITAKWECAYEERLKALEEVIEYAKEMT